jgi:hypothetical protein
LSLILPANIARSENIAGRLALTGNETAVIWEGGSMFICPATSFHPASAASIHAAFEERAMIPFLAEPETML